MISIGNLNKCETRWEGKREEKKDTSKLCCFKRRIVTWKKNFEM